MSTPRETTSQKFHNLSPEDCYRVYPVVLANADRHKRVADILAREMEWGNATAHIILGGEELVKALLLFLEGKSLNLRKVKTIKNIFSAHNARHSLIKEIFSVWLVLKPIVHRIDDSQPTEFRLKPEFGSSKFFNGLLTAVQLAYGVYNGFTNYRWWHEADILKQRGFYVDYDKELLTPDAIDREAYQKAVQQFGLLNTDLLQFISTVDAFHPKELENFKQLFEKAELEKQIQETLERAAKEKRKGAKAPQAKG